MTAAKIVCLECAQTNRLSEGKPAAAAKCGTCGAALFPNKPVEIDPATLAKASRTDDVPLVVDFWAPWCGPCRMMAPEFAKAAKELGSNARFVKLNTQDHPDAGNRYNIRGIPTLALFSKGREKARRSGAQPAADIVRFAQNTR